MAEKLRFKGKIVNVTISQTRTGKYFASFIVETEVKKKEPVKQTIGLDLGINHFCTTSAGEKVDNMKYYRSYEKRLAVEQRKLSRRYRLAKEQKRDLDRSEEHTSELQSRGHLVCRLLLEKKTRPATNT